MCLARALQLWSGPAACVPDAQYFDAKYCEAGRFALMIAQVLIMASPKELLSEECVGDDQAPRLIATGRTLLVSAARKASGDVMNAKCPASGIRINSFSGAFTSLK